MLKSGLTCANWVESSRGQFVNQLMPSFIVVFVRVCIVWWYYRVTELFLLIFLLVLTTRSLDPVDPVNPGILLIIEI